MQQRYQPMHNASEIPSHDLATHSQSRWLHALEENLRLQVLNLRLPFARARKQYPPSTIIHLSEKDFRLILCVGKVRGADDKGCQIEHDPWVLGVDVVLDVILPGVGRGWPIKRYIRLCQQVLMWKIRQNVRIAFQR